MQIAIATEELQFRHPFRIAHGMRTSTPVIYVRFSYEGQHGYGEACLPPYLKETVATVTEKIRSTRLKGLNPFESPDACLDRIHRGAPEDAFARCAMEEALLQLIGHGKQPFSSKTACTYTLGLTEKDSELIEKLAQASGFTVFKLKLTSDTDRDPVLRFRKYSNAPFCVDANQSWKDVDRSIAFTHWLKEQGALLVEQPFERNDMEKHARYLEASVLPSVADESIQNLEELRERYSYFSGVNVKLLKCGGPLEAEAMLRFAREKNMFRLIGCMSESTLGCSHAARLWKYADLLDLDGPFLITNDPFTGYTVKKGKPVSEYIRFQRELQFVPL